MSDATDFKPFTIQQRIDGLMYTSDKLPTGAGVALAPKLAVLLGQGVLQRLLDGSLWHLAAGLAAEPSQAEDDEARARLQAARDRSAADISYLLEVVAERADRVKFDKLARDLLAGMRCEILRPLDKDGGYVAADPEVFDRHFAGEYLHLLKVLIFAIRHSFAGPTLGSPSKSGSPGTPTDGQANTKGSSPATSTP